MRRRSCFSLLLTALLALGAAQADAANASPATAQQTIDALRRAHAAVVGIQVRTAADADSAETLSQQRQGSGVVIDADGLVLTIGYLLLDAEHIQIVTQDGRTLPAQAVAYDLATGFGLVKPLLPLRGAAPVPLGRYRDLEPGAVLMTATGAIDGADSDVAMTQLVSKRSFSGHWEYFIDAALFTSPPIPNHSGAPLFNQQGELVGIGSLFVVNALGENLPRPGNMFVPVDLLKPILAELQRTGSSAKSRRPWLGLNSAEQAGRVQVMRVSKRSPALAAGLQAGDVVLAVDGNQVTTLESFYKKLWDRAAPDADVQLTVLQGAAIKTITVKPVDRMRTLRKPAGI